MTSDSSIKEEVENLLRRGHEKDRITHFLVEKGHDKEDIKAALKETAVQRSGLPKSRYIHLVILIAVIVIILIPIIVIYRSASYDPPLVLDFDYEDLIISDISSFRDHFEAAINLKDGNLYFALLSPTLKELACNRWEGMKESFSLEGDCATGMGAFYSQELDKRFGDRIYQVSFNEHAETEFGTMIRGIAKGESALAFTIYLTEEVGSVGFASDYLLDAAIS